MIEVYVCQKFAVRSIVYCSFCGVDLSSIEAGFGIFASGRGSVLSVDLGCDI